MILEAVLRAVSFVDQLVIVDKSRSRTHRVDALVLAASRGIEARYCPTAWTPTVESTREEAVKLCENDWIVCLDDDEILSPACAEMFQRFANDGEFSVLDVPIRHRVLGHHDPAAYYSPEWRPTLFRRGAVEFNPTVHAGTRIVANRLRLHEDGDVYIDHLSHASVSQWLEKTNRYTDQPDRSNASNPLQNAILPWAIGRLGAYVRGGGGHDDYLDVVAVLRGLYDVVDGLKRWEAENFPDGDEVFAEIAAEVLQR